MNRFKLTLEIETKHPRKKRQLINVSAWTVYEKPTRKGVAGFSPAVITIKESNKNGYHMKEVATAKALIGEKIRTVRAANYRMVDIVMSVIVDWMEK